MNNQKVANREINKSYNYNPNLENYNHVQENDTTNEFSNMAFSLLYLFCKSLNSSERSNNFLFASIKSFWHLQRK